MHLGPSPYLDHGICAHLARWQYACRQSQRDQSSCGLIDQVTINGCVDVKMLEPGAKDYHVSRRGEIDQPRAIWRSCRVEAERSDSGTKDTFLANLRIEILEDNPDVMGREFVVEGSRSRHP